MNYRHNIAIVGLSTSFNVETARVVADDLELHFMDANRYLEFSISYRIDQIIEDFGKEYFLKCEKKIYKELQSYTNSVFGVSMTALLNKENIINLKKTSYIVLLKANSEITKKRFNQDYDNHMKEYIYKEYDQDISKIYEEIQQLSDIVVFTNKMTPVRAAQKVEQEMTKLILEAEE